MKIKSLYILDNRRVIILKYKEVNTWSRVHVHLTFKPTSNILRGTSCGYSRTICALPLVLGIILLFPTILDIYCLIFITFPIRLINLNSTGDNII